MCVKSCNKGAHMQVNRISHSAARHLPLLLMVILIGTATVWASCPITPYLKVNGGAWEQTNNVTVTSGASVEFGPQPISGGSWKWSGPSGFTSTSRQITETIKSTSTYKATFTTSSCSSTETFTVTVGSSSGGKTINNVYVTFYGWWDNSPPGNAIAYPKNQGNPTLHNVATAGGTFSNPSSFASDAKDGEFKVGDVIYVPYVKKYFINEDECTGSGPPVAGTGNCEADWEKRHEYHVDLWLGGNPPSNENDVLNCEDSLTSSGPVAQIILHPPSNEPVSSTPLYNSSTNTCANITPP